MSFLNYITNSSINYSIRSYSDYLKSSSLESLLNSYVPLLADRFNNVNNLDCKKKINIAIIGAGIGGCSTAYFLENLFENIENNEIKIDIYEKENHVGGSSTQVEYNGFLYDLNPVMIDFTQNYMKNFALNSGCKISNDIEENNLSALFDSNGILIQKYGKFNKLDNLRILLKNFGFKNAFKIIKWFIEFFKYRAKVYKLQDEGYSFDNVEKFIRKINPYIFTLSQHTFNELIKMFKNQSFINNLTNLACLTNLAQTNRVPGLIGLSSLISFFNSSYIKDDSSKIAKYLLSKCVRTRLYLNRHVKLLTYKKKNPDKENTIIYLKNSKEIKKTYDYVIITFPLTKNLDKQNFTLDILYRDFLDCEMITMNTYLIDGTFSMLTPKTTDRLFKLYTLDQSLKFNSIKTNTPIYRLKQEYDSSIEAKILYSVTCSNGLSEKSLNGIFEKGFKVVNKITNTFAPIYKKVRYSHTPFPQVIIDGKERSRVFYLNGLQWLDCSKESNCIAAKNIALLIAKKEIKNSIKFKQNLENLDKFSNENFYEKKFQNIFLITVFSCLCTLLLIKNQI